MRTHLGRSISPRSPAVRAALALSIGSWLVTLAVLIRNGVGIGDSFSQSLNVGLGALAAWAIGRELDPDDPASASYGAALAIALSWWLGTNFLVANVALLATVRLLARTTGRGPSTFDQLLLVGLSAWASRTAIGWVVSLGLAFATARDVRLPGPTSRLQLVTSLAIAVAATMSRLLANPGATAEWSLLLLVAAALGLIGGATLPTPGLLSSVGDLTRAPLDPTRLTSARRHAVAIVAISVVVVGAPAVAGFAPTLGAFLGTRLRHSTVSYNTT